VARVREGGHDVGFAFDGDGDRMLAVARDGSVVDGDEIIAAIALELKRRGELTGNGVAVTVMTNFGFHRAMSDAGVEVATTAVGDRHVVEELGRRGWVIGGEQSGHVVDMRLTPSGDGIAAALLLLQALGEQPLEGGAAMTKLPQVLVNVPVADRDALETASAVWEAVESESAELEGEGRVLVRPSGTEPVVRVMVEAPTQERCETICARVVAVVERELGRGVAA
jgi:phosphoglucosamine mutase